MASNQEMLETLKAECLQCQDCQLAKLGRKQVVFGQGKAPCDLLFIGEGPGADEDEQGLPFVGRSGQLLTQIIESSGLVRERDTYIANIVKCRPPQNRAPEKSEAEVCRKWLDKQLEIIDPKIIVLVGKVAMENFIKQDKLTISQARGQWFEYQGRDTTIIFHPSYLLRNPSKEEGSPKWLTWQDMKAIKSAWDYYQQLKP
jgi:uracil-DNA glycosylase